ncbi:hypothetical protein AWJ20_4942 [Sugiyamaella lignohabitans]|uniref:Uncharacterized protein n=1 Tax=Sugiyamaella lignohabitans TaxID=796027 RepID=A0A167EEX7_9ASCO|nr:uncharacterized protein AWJ20_4942 [Sugiyamaella lignohabitans]ANB13989.1 hypothetical protein AWJ20_4942 [Sugiyamaella lignohabitans]
MATTGASDFSIIALLTPPGAAPGTGLSGVIAGANTMFAAAGGAEGLGPVIIDQVIGELQGLFGDYPNSTDIAPSAIFLAIFAILGAAHLYIFLKDYSRGHRFWISFGLFIYCVFRVIGFACRISWAKDVLRINTGIVSVVFSQVSVLYMNVLCMILGHRIFTWRHPETGAASWFNAIISVIYLLICGVVAMAIVGQAIPYLYFLSPENWARYQKVVKAAAILNLLYALAGLALVTLAYTFKPGSIDHRLWRMPKMQAKDFLPPTIQPTWIESTGLFYFPRRGSQIPILKGDRLEKAIRVIPSREAPASGLTNSHSPDHTSGPSIRTAVIVVVSLSLILTMNVAFRVAAVFTVKPRGGGTPGSHLNAWVFHNYVFYIWYGAFEVIVNLILLLSRVDLRFYIPDMARKRRADEPLPNHQYENDEVKLTASNNEVSDVENHPQYDGQYNTHNLAE